MGLLEIDPNLKRFVDLWLKLVQLDKHANNMNSTINAKIHDIVCV